MSTIQKPGLGGKGGGGGSATQLQTAESYLLGQANVGTSSAGTDVEDNSYASMFSQNPTIMASSWDLPSKLGSLRLNTGNVQTTPVSPKTRSAVSSGVEMLNIYDKLDSGEKLTPADLKAASGLGPDIERAAQLQAGGKPNKSATTKAQNEIATRLAPTVGLTPEDFGKEGLNSKVSKSFAATMQNAGYGVTQGMTVKQALKSAQSVVGGASPPTTAQSNMTVSQYIQGLQSMSKAQLTQLQQGLYNGGFYDDTYYGGNDTTTAGATPKEYTQGVLDTGTILAFRQAILQTLVDQKQGKNTTLDQTITGGASTNPALGNVPVTSGLDSSQTSAAPTTVPLATQAQTQQPLIDAFVAALGRNPTQQELTAFTQSYQGQLTAGDKKLVASGGTPSPFVDQSGIPYVPGTPTASAAATNFAETQDPTEYQGHNIANSFGLLMNLVDRAGTSSLDTPGTRPTATT